ncbi:hypothetical protein KEM55_009079, partial [Ascosphaera atra]
YDPRVRPRLETLCPRTRDRVQAVEFRPVDVELFLQLRLLGIVPLVLAELLLVALAALGVRESFAVFLFET